MRTLHTNANTLTRKYPYLLISPKTDTKLRRSAVVHASRLYLDQTSLPHKFDTLHSCIIPRRTSILLYAPAPAWAASHSGKLACPSLDFFSTSPLSIDLPSLFSDPWIWIVSCPTSKVTRAEEISAEECHEDLSPLMSGSRHFIQRIEQ
jgi:hypothetical protein